MNADPPTFDLVHRPWILAQLQDGTVEELSLTDVFLRATDLRGLVGELPTQVFAINRLLLAIMYRAVSIDKHVWQRWWANSTLPAEEIIDYLTEHRGRFDLLDPTRPFYQVADLRTGKGEFTELDRLIGDAPPGHPFLTMRTHNALESLSLAEAARWVVTCQAFDVSGIKSGAVGDPRVKGGRGYPIGMGAAGHLGGILVEGEDQLQTLLLNLVPQDEDSDADDTAAWERDPADGPGPLHEENSQRAYRPGGRAELFTWQSRRIRLDVHDHRARAVLICNGDRFSGANLASVETMTPWRDSPAQAKALGEAQVYMPRRHQPGRSLWRGLEALLGAESNSRKESPPATLTWLALQGDAEVLDDAFVPAIRAIGVDYVNNSSIVGDIIDDRLAVPVRVIERGDRSLRGIVIDAVQRTDKAVELLARLRINLARAAGDDTDAQAIRTWTQESTFACLDDPFRRWLTELAAPDLDRHDAEQAWSTRARHLLMRRADDEVRAAGPHAWVGRRVDERHLTAGRAEAWFRTGLFALFPYLEEDPQDRGNRHRHVPAPTGASAFGIAPGTTSEPACLPAPGGVPEGRSVGCRIAGEAAPRHRSRSR